MDFFDHINEDLVSSVDNTFSPPGSHTSGLRSQLSQLLEILKQLLIEPSLLNKLLENLRIHNLRTPEIHNLIEYLIDQREVLLDLLLVELTTEIGLTDEDQLIEELNDHSSIDVSLGGGQENHVFVGDVDVAGTLKHEDRVVPVLFGGDNLRAEELSLCTGDIILEHPIDQDLSLLVDEHN